MNRREFSLAASLALLTRLGEAGAQAFPAKPIRLIVSGGPGSNSDLTARVVFPRLAEILGQPIVIENRPGAGGAIALDAGAKSAPDGLTWVLTSSAQATQAAMVKQLPFHPVNDFSWLGTVTTYPLVIGVAADSPIQTFQDLIQRAKAHPGKLTFSSVGPGSGFHLLGEWLNAEAGIELMHVPFKSGTSDLTEVLAGRVDVYINTMTAALPQARGGKIRLLAVTSPRRFELTSQVPAVAEFYPGIQYESWLTLIAAARTPPEIVTKVNQALRTVIDSDAIRKRLSEMGVGAAPGTADESRARMENDWARFRSIVKSRNIAQQ